MPGDDLPWTPKTTLEILDRAAAARPDAIALVCGDASLSYRCYAEAVHGLAGQWAHARGRCIVLLMRNSIALAVGIFAAQRAGAVVATLNPDYTEHELRPLIEDAGPVLIATHPDLVMRVEAAMQGAIPIELFDEQIGFLTRLDASAPPPPPSAEMDAVLQFTGGTTGRSKGALLTHQAVAANVAQREARLPTLFGDEVVVSAMPLFHVFAVAMGLHLAAYAAGALVILPRYKPELLLDAIETHKGTRLPAGPTLYRSLLAWEGLSKARLTTLRCCYSGSAPLSHDTLARWEQASGVPIYEGYGQSEAGPVLTYAGPSHPRKIGSVGRALPATQIEIVDPIAGHAVMPIGAVGEIRARGPQLMRGYLNRPEATAEALRDGWLYTGDIGRLDADGDLFIEDRKKDMAIVSGYNVYPREIDEVLAQHPAVADAASVGAPDAYRGELIVSFVVLREPADEPRLKRHCETMLAKHKRPARIIAVADMPRTAVGKTDKAALRALAARVQINE